VTYAETTLERFYSAVELHMAEPTGAHRTAAFKAAREHRYTILEMCMQPDADGRPCRDYCAPCWDHYDAWQYTTTDRP